MSTEMKPTTSIAFIDLGRRFRASAGSLALATLVCVAPTSARSEDPAPLPAAAAAPVPPPGVFRELLDAAIGGKPILDVVFRWEYAKQDAQQNSNAATARTRLGYQTGEFRGLSGLAEMVNTVSPKPSGYYDGVENNEGPQTIVADPERTDVNRAWLQFAKKEWAGLVAKGGRERYNLDDERWIGSVGWRQNEQTFDAAHVQTTLGVDKLLVQYMYSWEVNRIFADKGPANRRDFNPRSHFLNASYNLSPAFNTVGFVYLVDPDENVFLPFGSQTYGVRFAGLVGLNDKLSIPYRASYAYQQDWGNNQTSYGAHYFWLESGLAVAKVVTFTAGYEHLGSDRDAVVVTPFATAHKFNGYADAFLNNGGNRGLRDLFVSVAPAIPLARVGLTLIFHQFWDDQGGDDLGQEYDAVATYALNQYIGFLYKVAYYDGGKKPAFSTVTRSTLQMTFKF